MLDKLKYLDPFHYFDAWWERHIGSRGPEKLVAEIIYAFVVAYVFYTVLGIILSTPRPAVIVASESMIPTLYPGDIVFVKGEDPRLIRAPEIELNVDGNFVMPERVNISFIHENGKTVAIKAGDTVIPVTKTGDIIVYHDNIKNRDIIHRVVLKIRTPDGRYYFLTKGDNDATNPYVDQECIGGRCIFPYLVPENAVLGTSLFAIPRIGIIKLILFPA